MMGISSYVQATFLERMRAESNLGAYVRYVPWPVMIASLLPPILFIAYCIWWKSNVKHLRTVPTSGCDNHLAMAATIIYHLCRNQIVDANVLFFQLLRGMVKVHQMSGYRLFYMWTGMRPVVICFGADFFEAILKSSINLRKSFDYSFLRLWLKDGLVTSEGSKWKQRRKTITSTFHFRILEDFIPIFDEQSRILIHKLEKDSAKGCLDIVPYVTMCTLDIICETAMGISVHAQMDQDVPYLRAMHKVCESFVSRVMRPWLWPSWIFFSLSQGRAYIKNTAVMDNFTRQVIRNKKQALISRSGVDESIESDTDNIDKPKKKKAFLDLLLDLHLSDPLQFTETDIQEEVDSFMFAGHDTTAVGISWALYLLGLYPEIQVKVQDEIRAVFGNDKSRPVTEKDLKELKYLDCVIKETQRVYTPAPYIGRELLEDVKVNEITIPKGTTCMMLIYMLHRDEAIFPNPEVFDPDRFLPENCLNRHPFAFCPFSAGPRSCIGQKFAMLEEKTVIANFLRHFDVHSLDERDKLQLTAEMVLRSRKGIRMKLIPRK